MKRENFVQSFSEFSRNLNESGESGQMLNYDYYTERLTGLIEKTKKLCIELSDLLWSQPDKESARLFTTDRRFFEDFMGDSDWYYIEASHRFGYNYINIGGRKTSGPFIKASGQDWNTYSMIVDLGSEMPYRETEADIYLSYLGLLDDRQRRNLNPTIHREKTNILEEMTKDETERLILFYTNVYNETIECLERIISSL